MQRLRLFDLRASRLPQLLGFCQDDVPNIAKYVNTAQRRLLYCKEVSDEGWYGSWAEILFYVTQAEPYITLPREVARIEMADICNLPVPVNNQFFEFLRFGNGRMPKCRTACGAPLQIYSRNNAVTFVDISNPPQYISVFITSDQDVGKRMLIQGLDQNNNVVSSQDVVFQVEGVFVAFTVPFVTTSILFNSLTGLQKDQTVGQVKVYQTDPTSGENVLLLTMEPSEMTASYRRYFVEKVPRNCCPTQVVGNVSPVPVTAIAKLDLIPVKVDTDYCLIQNMEAIIEECQSVRFSEMDNENAKKMAAERHFQAIRMLNGELTHFYGSKTPAIEVSPFGSAHLNRQYIGQLI